MRSCAAVLLLLAFAGPALLRADIITFEEYPDSTSLTTQYPGLTFTNATVITAGISLNEFEFPPHSGTNVVFDDGGPISISFATPVLSFGGYFTYLEPLTLAGFGATSTQVTTAFSAFSNNLALSGDPGSSPNEFLSLAFAGGISSVTITGDPSGSSFVMDDATYSTVPEPSSVILILANFAMIVVIRRQKIV